MTDYKVYDMLSYNIYGIIDNEYKKRYKKMNVKNYSRLKLKLIANNISDKAIDVLDSYKAFLGHINNKDIFAQDLSKVSTKGELEALIATYFNNTLTETRNDKYFVDIDKELRKNYKLLSENACNILNNNTKAHLSYIIDFNSKEFLEASLFSVGIKRKLDDTLKSYEHFVDCIKNDNVFAIDLASISDLKDMEDMLEEYYDVFNLGDEYVEHISNMSKKQICNQRM